MNLVNRKTFILLSKIETSSIATYIKRGKIIMENNMFDLDNQINIDTINKINSRKIKSKITFCKKECKFCNQVKYKKEFLVINNKRGKRLSTLCANCLHEKNLKQKEISKEKRKAAYKKSYLKRKNNKKISNYIKTRRKNDELFDLSMRMRCLINGTFRRNGIAKSKKTVEILGCSIPYFKKHIESNFKDGMSWINRNKWHIDHKKPLCTAKTIDDIIELNHYTNLQPLWAIDNLKKGGRYANN